MSDKSEYLSRRSLIGASAAAAVVTTLPSQAVVLPPPAPSGPRGPQGGDGPIRVMFVSQHHPFDRENLFTMLDGFGREITWTHVENPAAMAFMDPKLAKDYDVFLYYDAFNGRKELPRGADGQRRFEFSDPPAEYRANLKKLLQNGDKGFVFFHHAISSWVRWPEYVEMTGAAAEWDVPLTNIRGKNYPRSGYRGGTPQTITVVDQSHPITAGLPPTFEIVDEAYLCPIFEDSVHPLLRTNFEPVAESFRPEQAGHPRGSNLTAWVKVAERSPLAYIQHGHDNLAWSNPYFQKLILNAIKWAASPDAKNWSHANPKKIFS
jgi:type 1 glutamine amidotransferase